MSFFNAPGRVQKASQAIIQSVRGQVTIMVGMMMLTFMLFFAFVVNTGMLINAKINLQNAADMAAYAGAAAQARQLNKISFLNYEMRRQYKKFLFRYYVMGNMAQKTAPGQPLFQANGQRRWSPDGNVSYDVPTTCMVFNPLSNDCGIDKTPAITLPAATPGDNIQATLRDQLKLIGKANEGFCVRNGRLNVTTLIFWLYNTDPDLKRIEQELSGLASGADADALRAQLNKLKGVVYGLGLVPNQILLSRRILTLEDYVNSPPQIAVNKEKADTLAQFIDSAKYERTILAYNSAFQSLGDHTFDNIESIELDELLPSSGDDSNLLELKPIRLSFSTYATDYQSAPGAAADDPKSCQSRLVPINVQNMPAGYYKDPNLLTYYSIRLSARAKVMFSPFGDVKLTAYAAAQPFGSRVGPNLDPVDFLRQAMPGSSCATFGGVGAQCEPNIPNLPIQEQDSATTGQGWDQNEVLATYFQQFQSNAGVGSGGQIPAVLSRDDMERAYHAAMGPNPWESGKYNIPGDLSADPFVSYFNNADGVYAMWAPLISPEVQSDSAIEAEIDQFLNEMTAPSALEANNPDIQVPGTQFPPGFKDALRTGLMNHLDRLRTGGGDASGGYKITRLVDPFRAYDSGGPISLPSKFFMNSVEQVKTSWNQVRDGSYHPLGRTGYSVKFVAFKTLLEGRGVSSDGAGTMWQNPPVDPTGIADGDFPYLEH